MTISSMCYGCCWNEGVRNADARRIRHTVVVVMGGLSVVL